MWSFLRIFLVVLNVLGAVAFFAVAAMDYGKRHSWSYAVLLHDVALHGLPLDNDEMDGENRKIADLLGENGKKDVFLNQGSAIGTQLEEVTRFKQKLDSAISGAADKKIQTVSLAQILTPLAVTESQREQLVAIQRYLADPKSADQLKADVARAALAAKDEKRKPPKPFDVAFVEEMEALRGPSRKPFEDAFLAEKKKAPEKKPEDLFEDSLEQIRQNLQTTYNDAFEPAVSGKIGGKDVAPAERKAIVASLLLDLILPMGEIEKKEAFAPDLGFELTEGSYKRYLTVVGLDAAVKAIRQRAVIMGQMADDLQLEIKRDQTLFVTTHQDLVNQLQQAAAKESELSEALSRQKDLVAKHQALVARRQQDITLFEGELAKLTKETAERLAEVRTMDDELYKVRVATRNAIEANQKHEQKIRSLEAGH